MMPVGVAGGLLPPVNLSSPGHNALPSGVPLDILHIPKPLQA
ncbi:MAG TPA: hypothetical protein VH583_17160 [Vicinamibacterales bacterium]